MNHQRRDLGAPIRNPLCTTGKVSYDSQRHAQDAHRRVSWKYRLYHCPDCGGWHVTNQEKRT